MAARAQLSNKLHIFAPDDNAARKYVIDQIRGYSSLIRSHIAERAALQRDGELAPAKEKSDVFATDLGALNKNELALLKPKLAQMVAKAKANLKKYNPDKKHKELTAKIKKAAAMTAKINELLAS